ncbi:hypothetical protein BA895_13420 [Humibacillus sp. DSM 29435]|uniref:ArsR/SmtB family transcription factor n=1 Tax=Humibacillus sp. DSM 29435 TaxID=1869167 RepID=UPI000872657D|nr:winged helix-turn-helix domain-containing protein [Humibacillus sp. DSM 29435]OFE17806.1 hypothetical protein BA895_13420 [Humibacillus sp. DSM 29435]
MNPVTPDAAEATAAQMKALSHPSRVRLWAALGPAEATISQLSHRLNLNKGNVSHHLGVLLTARLVTLSRSQTVRGGTERYFSRAQGHLLFPATPGGTGPGSAMIDTMAEDVRAASEPHVHQRTMRLTREQADALIAHFDTVLHSLPPADEHHPVYQVVTALYRRP